VKGVVTELTNFDKQRPYLDDLGVKVIRPWLTIAWNRPPTPGFFNAHRAAAAQGYKIILCTSLREGATTIPTPEQAYAWYVAFGKAVGDPRILEPEIGNEVNLKQYWPGSLDKY